MYTTKHTEGFIQIKAEVYRTHFIRLSRSWEIISLVWPTSHSAYGYAKIICAVRFSYITALLLAIGLYLQIEGSMHRKHEL